MLNEYDWINPLVVSVVVLVKLGNSIIIGCEPSFISLSCFNVYKVLLGFLYLSDKTGCLKLSVKRIMI